MLDGANRNQGDRKRGDEYDEAPAPKSPSYMVKIALDRNWVDTEAGRITHGAEMSVTAEVYTGRRRIISFLLSPLQRVVGESGHER